MTLYNDEEVEKFLKKITKGLEELGIDTKEDDFKIVLPFDKGYGLIIEPKENVTDKRKITFELGERKVTLEKIETLLVLPKTSKKIDLYIEESEEE